MAVEDAAGTAERQGEAMPEEMLRARRKPLLVGPTSAVEIRAAIRSLPVAEQGVVDVHLVDNLRVCCRDDDVRRLHGPAVVCVVRALDAGDE